MIIIDQTGVLDTYQMLISQSIDFNNGRPDAAVASQSAKGGLVLD